MIKLKNTTMEYPVPLRYREILLRPFIKREKITAIKNIDLNINKGERVAFLGPNGAGKTTILKLIGGLLLPTEGSILVNGHDTQKNNMQARRSVGYIMNEERSFYWRLTGIQNLEFFGTLENIYGENLKDRINHLLNFVGLSEAADKRVGTYSSGMKQRLAIARGLLAEPDILILDEPTRTLDPIASEEVCEFIMNDLCNKLNKTLLIATHNLYILSTLCSSVCLMNNQQIISYDTIENVFHNYKSIYEYYLKNIK